MVPAGALATAVLGWLVQVGAVVGSVGALALGAIFAAVFHAEVIAHRVGEPFGTLVLAVAVTVIEVALIVSLMLVGGDTSGLARDTVFAAVMIACNGIVGMCLLVGGVRHREQTFRLEGALATLAVLAALTTLTLVVPNFTTSAPGPMFSVSQLVFAGLVSLVLYGAYVFVQTIRHRDYFLPPAGADDDSHATPPGAGVAVRSFALLLACLVSVVWLAKSLSPTIEGLVTGWGAPKAFVGVIIAAVVLTPEALAAVRAARIDRLQTSMNLALGSALASIALTIPAVSAVAILIDAPLALGLGAKEIVLLFLTLLLATLTLGTGRTTVLQGVVHLVVFAAFVFLTLVP